MLAPKRRINSSLIDRLLENPHRFGFFQAVRVLEQWFATRDASVLKAGDFHDVAARIRPGNLTSSNDRNGDGEAGIAYQLSFPNTLSLAFPPSEIQALHAYSAAGQHLQPEAGRGMPLAPGRIAHIAVTPSFFGLLGVQGALPLHYTERIAEREVFNRDTAARAYLDIFSNRATALFYGAWKKYRLALHYESDRNERYTPYLFALAGVNLHMQTTLKADSAPYFDEAIVGHVSAIRHKPMSAAYLQQVLTDYFIVPIRIHQFVGKWYAVPTAQYTQLGQNNATLGMTALLGQRVWQRDMCVCLEVGPLNLKQYRAFLNGAENAVALKHFLQLVASIPLEYDVRLILHRDDVMPICLGANGRLGQDAFLATRPASSHRRDARYALPLMG